MKKILALKKHLTLKRVMTGVAIIAVLVMIAVPIIKRHQKNSRNNTARDILQRIVYAEMGTQTCGYASGSWGSYAYTDGVNETAEEAVRRLGLRPDASIAFHIIPIPASYNITDGFIAFAAHNSVGSTVYVYEHVHARRFDEIREAHENDVYSGGAVTSSVPALFCYQYDPSNTATPIVKKPGSIKFAPDQNDKSPARMIVTVAAE